MLEESSTCGGFVSARGKQASPMENDGTRQIALVVNPKSGKGSEPREVAKRFAAQGLPVELFEAADPVEAAKQARAAGARTVVAAGGDGTVSAVASVLAGSDVALGIVPAGTLNHLAKELRIPTDQDAAIRVIAAGRLACVDVAEVNGRVFVNNSSLGLYPAMVTSRKKEEKLGRGRWMALFRASVMTLRRMPRIDVRLTAGDTQIERRTPIVFVGNNPYEVEGMKAGSRVRLNTGKLFVSIATARSGLDMIRLSLLALLGRLKERDEFEAFLAEAAVVESHREHIRISLDGEVVTMNTPLHYRIRPACLHIIVPEGETASKP